jgi:hypothetical protein
MIASIIGWALKIFMRADAAAIFRRGEGLSLRVGCSGELLRIADNLKDWLNDLRR